MTLRALAVHAALGLACATALPAQQHFDSSGFERLFDGKTLAGWVTHGGRYDGKADWSVEQGAITGRQSGAGEGGLLYTERSFANCIFVCDVRMSYPFDSGIFLRMVPADGGKGAQVTLDYRPDGEIGAVYSDGFLQHNQTAAANFKPDHWHRVEVLCAGRDFAIQAWLDGAPITDYRLPKGSEGYAPRGLIGLQVHGGRDDPPGSRVQFKNIAVLSLPDYDPDQFTCDGRGMLTPTKGGVDLGWRALFDGKSLDGWQVVGEPGGIEVQQGVLALGGAAGELRSREDFQDFELRLDFKIAELANSGVFLRGAHSDVDPAQSGCEVQILDDFHWEDAHHSKLQAWQFTGSLYHSVPPGEKALAAIGEWNSYQILYQGTRLRVELNGRLLYDVDTAQVPTNGWPAFADRAPRGFIGLQRHSDPRGDGKPYVWFKNVFVRPLR